MKLFLFCYDIPGDKAGAKRRNKLVKLLEGHGDRVQFSVFEGRFESEEELNKVWEKAKTILNPNLDSLRLYPFHADTELGIKILGQGTVFRVEELYIV